MMYFDIFPDSSRIVYSTCAYTREDLGLEEEGIEENEKYELARIGLVERLRIWSIVVSDLDETETAQRAEQGNTWVYNYEIVLSDIAGANTKRLTENTHFDNFPTVSPDGTKVAFISGSGFPNSIFLARGERIVIHTVSTGESREIDLPERLQVIPIPLKWSPDGERLAFVGVDYGSRGEFRGRVVYTIGVDGSGLTATTYTASGPAWHPDGERIAAVVPLGESGEELALYTFAADGSDPIPVSANLPRPWGFPQSTWMGDLSWSPDATGLLLKDHGYVVPLDGSPPVEYGPPRIPFEVYGQNIQFSSILDTSWSPDGMKVATRNLKSLQWEEKPGIAYAQDRDGANIRSLVEVVETVDGDRIRLTNEEQ